MALLSQIASAHDVPIRVMVVDDAVVVRGLFTRWLNEEPDMEVVGICRNGHEAVENVLRINPEVVLLDIDMPELDGLAALPLLLARKPDLVVIMASALTRRNAEVSLKALSLGATDYVPKPATNSEVTSSLSFRRELIEKIRILGRRRFRQAAGPKVELPAQPDVSPPKTAFRLRAFSAYPPRALVIGSSTGGPQALQVLARALQPVLNQFPVLIAQHMPPTFTTIMAEHLNRATQRPAREAIHGEALMSGTIYVAPGGKHLKVERKGETVHAILDDGPPVHFCKPSVEPLFSSAAAIFGHSTLSVILTGMGNDGMNGALEVAAAGGSVIAQDEATSVVWGMPGAVAHAGICSAVLPLDDIAPQIIKLVHAGEP